MKSHLRVSQLPTSVLQPKESLHNLLSNAFPARFTFHFSPLYGWKNAEWERASEHHQALYLPELYCQVAVLSFSFTLREKTIQMSPLLSDQYLFFHVYTMTCNSNALVTNNFYNWLQQDRFLEITFISLY